MNIDENPPAKIFRDGVGGKTDNQTGHGSKPDVPEVPLPADDEAPVEEELSDVDANNSVSSEHPPTGSTSRASEPDVDPQLNDQGEDAKEPRGVPASDPESGA